MQARLPRELRDIVYRDLFGKPYYRVRVPPNNSAKHISSHVVPNPQSEGRWFNQDFVGSHTLREIVETWWAVSTFDITELTDEEERQAFLREELWGYGVTGYSHIKHVFVRIRDANHDRHEDALFGHDDRRRPFGWPSYTPDVPSEPMTVSTHLNDLKGWIHNVRITYVINGRVDRQWDSRNLQFFLDAAPTFLNGLVQLTDVTAGISVVWFFGEKADDNCIIEISRKHLAMTKDDWLQEVANSPKDVLSPEEVTMYLFDRLISGETTYGLPSAPDVVQEARRPHTRSAMGLISALWRKVRIRRWKKALS